MESLKPDCACALQRKTLRSLAAGYGVTLSPVRFDGETCTIAAISSDFQRNTAGFLCVPDCVAEREGFGPTVHIDNTYLIDSTLTHIPRLPHFPDMTAQKRHNRLMRRSIQE